MMPSEVMPSFLANDVSTWRSIFSRETTVQSTVSVESTLLIWISRDGLYGGRVWRCELPDWKNYAPAIPNLWFISWPRIEKADNLLLLKIFDIGIIPYWIIDVFVEVTPMTYIILARYSIGLFIKML